MSHCSPSRSRKINFTCFSNDELKEIANAYNNIVINKEPFCKKKLCIPMKKIDFTKINKSKDPKYELYKNLKNRFEIISPNEYDWVNFPFIKNISNKEIKKNIQYFTFKPTGPKTLNTWFDSNNINNIFKQYSIIPDFKNFIFLGAQPSDFVKISNYNYNDIIKQYKYIGVILNTDPHNKPGKHWVAIYIDNHSKTLDYFDSLGEQPNKYIKDFIKMFKSKNYNIVINKKEHQKGGSNCGAYACYFILKRLNGFSFDDINNDIITDKMMTDYRLILFKPK